MMDKSKELNASVTLVNDKLHFKTKVGENEPISIDYTPPLGDNLGYTSLELFLLSLSSCLGSSVLTFLRKMRKTITRFEIHSRGIRREEHPTCFKTILLIIDLKSSDTSFCPVCAMIKCNVDVEIEYHITV
jgi:putative redox protein